MIRRPPAAKKRPIVRVVHPCGSLLEHQEPLLAGLEALESAGCEVRWDETRSRACWRDHLAGDDQARLNELLNALVEPEVDVVWFARGGAGGARIVEPLLHRAESIRPRLLVGFSDATSILNALSRHLGWITFHGPVVTSLGRPRQFDINLPELLATLTGDRTHLTFTGMGRGSPTRGILRGGNLTVLASTAGTVAWPHSQGAIWLLEEVNEPPYKVDRTFFHLKAAGLLAGAAALWLGDLGLAQCDARKAAEGIAEDAGQVPVWRNAPAGHRGRLDLLPIGGEVLLDPAGGQLLALSPWVNSQEA